MLSEIERCNFRNVQQIITIFYDTYYNASLYLNISQVAREISQISKSRGQLKFVILQKHELKSRPILRFMNSFLDDTLK